MNRTLLLPAAVLVFAAGITFGRHLPRSRDGDTAPNVRPGDFVVVTYPDPSKPMARDSRTLVVSEATDRGLRPGAAAAGGWAITFDPGTSNQRTYLAAPPHPDGE